MKTSGRNKPIVTEVSTGSDASMTIRVDFERDSAQWLHLTLSVQELEAMLAAARAGHVVDLGSDGTVGV